MSRRTRGLHIRAFVLAALRKHLTEAGFLEVETPVWVPTPAVETHIDAVPCSGGYLRTSPELHMKRLLAEGLGNLFQIGPCFRQGETGRIHHPEYTMLEWYEVGGSARTVQETTKKLFRSVVAETASAHALDEALPASVEGPWKIYTVSEVFLEKAGWDPVEEWDANRFDLDLVERVEPSFDPETPTILRDYPPQAAALSRIYPDRSPPVAERWELYWRGLELANAFTELTDPVEQRQRFEQANREREAMGQTMYDLDEPFLESLEQGMPSCGGIALGVDRLVMCLAGADHLDEVMAFRERHGSMAEGHAPCVRPVN